MKKDSPRRQIFDAIDYMADEPIGIQVVDVEIDQVDEFKDHPFYLYEGQRLDDMVESIAANGVLNPVIVRKKPGGRLEMLSGHNRMNASKLAGKSTIPAVIKEDLSDEDAYIYVIETNLMQRSFNDLHDSEKGAVLKLRYDKITSQGRRSDIVKELGIMENGDISYEDSKTIDSRGRLAKEYGFSDRKVSRLIRLTHLIDEWKMFVDNESKAFLTGVNLSYLSKEMQRFLYQECEEMGIKLTLKNAEKLKKLNAGKPLDEQTISKFLLKNEKEKIKPKAFQNVKLSAKTYKKYFQNSSNAAEVESIIESALEQYFENRGLKV